MIHHKSALRWGEAKDRLKQGYVQRENYEEAAQWVMTSLKNVRDTFGPTSIETSHELLKLAIMFAVRSSQITEYSCVFDGVYFKLYSNRVQDRDDKEVKDILGLKYTKTRDEQLALRGIGNITDLLSVDQDRFGNTVFKPIFDELLRNIPYTKSDGSQFTSLSNRYKVKADATLSVLINDEELRTLVVEVKSSLKKGIFCSPVVYGVLVEQPHWIDANRI
ncbi:hypothetical protein BDB00DRAFT_786937 [Zychaea mexicana]|uniref:uncharacterized protein n=1 Tax=Zychaea mexicana TaxID=64656 RepID=UPI0022FE4EAE|nr:uncharacterized protein BDB00DRAFT_786937 [Zychaea mexicana]KAI9494838.1 hypothetical protein BDB00DRAFT_786937 [Zychaea mexicana]